MVNKLCFLNKRVEQGGKSFDTPLLYKKEKIVQEFAPLKHPTTLEYQEGSSIWTSFFYFNILKERLEKNENTYI